MGRSGPRIKVGEIVNRPALLTAFLDGTKWADRPPVPLAGDASNRRYLRTTGPDGDPVVIMDAPPEKGEDTTPFVDATNRLRQRGLSAPEILAADTDSGFLVLEDLGDDLFARVLAESRADETLLYSAAVDVLVELQRDPSAADGLPPYDQKTCLNEALLITEWYLPGLGQPADMTDSATEELRQLFLPLLADILPAAPVCVLRDYHAENLLWLPERTGLARVGLLDYQDALAGHPAYDLVSLLEDARRDTAPELQQAMLTRHIASSGADETDFRRSFALLGAQRNLKILGIFARLAQRDGKPAYIEHMPRVWAHLQNDLGHPDLAGLKDWAQTYLPAPDASARQALAVRQ